MWKSEDNLISATTLKSLIGRGKVVIFDCRFDLRNIELGHQQYLAGHIPSARYISLDDDLADQPGKRGRHPLPRREDFATVLRSHGVNNDSFIVAYDDSNSIFACRLWWMVRWAGHEKIAILNGGLKSWLATGLALTTTQSDPKYGTFALKTPLTRQVEVDDVQSHQGVLIDARSTDRFHGQNENMDHTAGHIPGALCCPFSDNLDESGLFVAAGKNFEKVSKNEDIISYCGSGVTATHNILALILAGYDEPALYAGSWSEWIENPTRPIATT